MESIHQHSNRVEITLSSIPFVGQQVVTFNLNNQSVHTKIIVFEITFIPVFVSSKKCEL